MGGVTFVATHDPGGQALHQYFQHPLSKGWRSASLSHLAVTRSDHSLPSRYCSHGLSLPSRCRSQRPLSPISQLLALSLASRRSDHRCVPEVSLAAAQPLRQPAPSTGRSDPQLNYCIVEKMPTKDFMQRRSHQDCHHDLMQRRKKPSKN
ncbi:hypothetical protein MRB53_010389 [Persea americana]|uniref:Uncharacterized protein n=1 Tax=Persea americana TaxID=3435 RepID=A0ACC2LSQ1_PERAE|nr:hypothetical protein MRB53_010389 [Persea americana]